MTDFKKEYLAAMESNEVGVRLKPILLRFELDVASPLLYGKIAQALIDAHAAGREAMASKAVTG